VSNTTVALSGEDPPLVYVGTDVGFVYRSTDGGVTWDEVRLLPDDRPLLGVSMIDLGVLRLPNDGLLDPLIAGTPPWTYGRFDAPGGAAAHRPDVVSHDVTFPNMMTSHVTQNERGHSGGYAMVGPDARIEAEDPGNLMANYFRSVAAQPGQVNWISICQSQPEIAFAATNFGAFRTRDRGITWDRVFVGTDLDENIVRCAHCDPENPDRVYLATEEGLRISENNGDVWRRASALIGIWPSHHVTTHPNDRDVVLVGSLVGAFATTPAGDRQTLMYKDRFPSTVMRKIRFVRPTRDPDTVYYGGYDGGWHSHDGGWSLARTAGNLFNHYPMRAISVHPDNPDHVYFQSNWHVFESRDGGATLTEILASFTELKFSRLAPNDADTLWLVGKTQLWRYEPQRPPRQRGLSAQARRARQALLRDPGHQVLEDLIMRQAGIDDQSIQQHLRRVRLSHLLPTVNVVGWFYRNSGAMGVGGVGFPQMYTRYFSVNDCDRYWNHVFTGAADQNHCKYEWNIYAFTLGSPFARNNGGAFAILSWPLGRVVANEQGTGRVWQDIRQMRDRVMDTVYLYWSDRRRLLEYLAHGNNTAAEERAYELRLEEMSAVLDALSGGSVGGAYGDQTYRLND
jgi:photosystem II stability/assembly factor-like uncharacterized protein